MTQANESVILLSRALDQCGDVLAAVHEEQLSLPTPCADWDVATLIGHLVATPGQFLTMARGEEVDWTRGPTPATAGWATEFRSGADDLIHYWHEAGDAADPNQVDMQTVELATHTWDLAQATGQQRPLDPEVAERGLAFVSGALTEENRGAAFGPAREAPDGASPYERLAAFTGRSV